MARLPAERWAAIVLPPTAFDPKRSLAKGSNRPILLKKSVFSNCQNKHRRKRLLVRSFVKSEAEYLYAISRIQSQTRAFSVLKTRPDFFKRTGQEQTTNYTLVKISLQALFDPSSVSC